jgi:hypothetical protein
MKCLGIVLLLLSTSNLFSQVNKESNKSFYTEFNLVRYSNISYLLKDNKVGNSLNFLNGIKVGMKKKNTEFYLSYIKFNNETFQSNGFSGGFYNAKSYQIGLGINNILLRKNKFSFLLGNEILFRRSTYIGYEWTDFGSITRHNGIKTYDPGIGTSLQINYMINPHIEIAANTRFCLNYRIRPSFGSYEADSWILYQFEPLNSLTIRLNIEYSER